MSGPGELKDRREPVPWYFSKASMAVAFLCVGPFMLPLVWNHPTLSRGAKRVWTAAILVLTLLFAWSTYVSVRRFLDRLDFLLSL